MACDIRVYAEKDKERKGGFCSQKQFQGLGEFRNRLIGFRI